MICVEGGGKEAYFKHEDVVAIELRPVGAAEGCFALLTMRTPQCIVCLNEAQWNNYRRMIRGNETDAETPVRSSGESTALGYPIGCHSFEKKIVLQSETTEERGLVMASCDCHVVADYCQVSICLMDPSNGKEHTMMMLSMEKDFPSMVVIRDSGSDNPRVLFEMELPKNSEWKKPKK